MLIDRWELMAGRLIEWLTARPMRLRLLIFNMLGRLLFHARRLTRWLSVAPQWIAGYQEGLRLLPSWT